MIQLGYFVSGFRADGTKYEFLKVIGQPTYKNHTELFNNVEKDLPDNLKENIFYTVAHHLKGARKYETWQGQDIIPFDLDGIDLDRIDEYPPLAANALGIDLSKTAIVYSGNGVHILVKVKLWTDKDFIKENRYSYKMLYDKIVRACKEAGLPITRDTTSWDYARVLRVPGTVNKKVKDGKEIIKECKLIQNNLEIQELEFPKNELKDRYSLKQGTWPKADIETITEECAFFKWLKEKPEEVHEPHAYAMLSITGHFDDDQETSKTLWERFDSPSINSKDLVEFTEQAVEMSGPRTCDGIAQIWEGCKDCPHCGRIKSPILLRSRNFIGSEHLGFTIVGANGGKIRQYDDLVHFFHREFNYHVTYSGKVYVFNGKHYEEYPDSKVKAIAEEYFTSPVTDRERSEFLAKVKVNYQVEESWRVSSPKGLINFQNGVLDINTKTLSDHSPEHNFFSVLPYEYDQNATAPNFEQFLNDITLNREALKNILLEYMGYSISGMEYLYNKALILSGSGKNGKSTFVNVLREVVGSNNCASISLTKASSSEYLGAELLHKMVNISEEEGVNVFKDTGMFKTLTGNSTFQARKIYESPFMMINRAKIIMTYNEMPYVGDSSKGIRRRLMIVPFELNLNSKPTDHKLLDKLKAELPGIFNLALEGLNRLLEQDGFTHSEEVEALATETVEASNNVLVWFKDSVIITDSEEDRLTTNELYKDYQAYTEENKEGYIASRRKFMSTLKNYFINNSLKCSYGKYKIDGKVSNGVSMVKLNRTGEFYSSI